MKLVRLKCIEDYFMENSEKTFTKGQKYVFVKKGKDYVGFDDEWNSLHWMDKKDLKECFDFEEMEKISL